MGERRVFVEAHEVPGLVLGALRGEPAALRRILGARRGGRIGAIGCALALVCAAPPRTWLALAAVHVALSVGVFAATRRTTGLGVLQVLRVSLWPAFALVALAAPLRVFWPTSPVPALIAILVASALLLRGLARGIDGVDVAQ